MNSFSIIEKIIKKAEGNEFLEQNQAILTGYSGDKLIGLLQGLSKEFVDEKNCYLEVGVFQGLTLLSVAQSIKIGEAYGIDNFAFFDREGKNLSIINERKKKLNIDNVNLINLDYEDALENIQNYIGDKKIGVYFIDGPHDYRSQLVCLLLAKPFLSDNAIIVVDDCNYRHVRQANSDFLKSHPEFKLLFQTYTKSHPLNLKGRDYEEVSKGWWNGVNILVKDITGELEPFLPETYRDRTLYEQDHGIHTVKYPDVIFKLYPVIHYLSNLFKWVFPRKSKIKGAFKNMNTYSEDLKKNNFNPSI